MAHATHYKRPAVKNILKEHNRELSEYKNNVNTSDSYKNYGFGMAGQSVDKMMLYINARCRDVMQGKKMQTQTSIINEWVVSYPKELCDEKISYDADGNKKIRYVPKDENQCKEWMKEVYEFTSNRYGQENMVGGWIHLDETTPHIQIVHIPVTTSRKTGKLTVSSASLITKNELIFFHKDLQKHMINKYGSTASDWILNGRTEGNLTNREYAARKKHKAAMDKRKEELDNREAELDARETDINDDYQVLDENMPKLLRIISSLTGKEYSFDEPVDLDEITKDLENSIKVMIINTDLTLKTLSECQDLLIKAGDTQSVLQTKNDINKLNSNRQQLDAIRLALQDIANSELSGDTQYS